MREDAVQYHRRVIDEFVHAIINKGDAREEAVNLLMSANNLENHGFTRILLKEEAEVQLRRPSSRGAERIFSDYSKTGTRAERAGRRHHKVKHLFTQEELQEAIDSGDEDKLDRYVRMYLGFRMETVPNVEERGTDVVGQHSHFDPLHMFPTRKGQVAFTEAPLFQQLNRHLYGNNARNAKRLDKTMKDIADNLHPSLKKDHMFSQWRGNNATTSALYQYGLDDFKTSFAEQFGQDHPLLSHPLLDMHFMRVKNWENEGIPRRDILKRLFDEDGIPKGVGRSGKSPVDELRTVANSRKDRNSIPTEDEVDKNGGNFGRTGLESQRLGIGMLPFQDQYNIAKWMLLTNGGTRNDGTIDDSGLKRVFNKFPDLRGYMAHHAFMIDNMLHTLHAGGAGRNGESGTLPNRFSEQATADARANIEEKYEETKEQLKLNQWSRLDDSQLENALNEIDMMAVLTRFQNKNNMGVQLDGDSSDTLYPHFHEDALGSTIFLNSHLPDMKDLVRRGFFNEGELEHIIEAGTNQKVKKDFTDLMRHTINGYMHTNEVNEFDMLEEPELKDTPLGVLMEGVGRRGNSDGDWGDFINGYESAMPGVLFSELPSRRVMMSRRAKRTGSGANPAKEQLNIFDPTKDTEGQTRQDLMDAIREYGMTEQMDDLLAQYDAGQPVNLVMPRGEMSAQEMVETGINPFFGDYRGVELPDEDPSTVLQEIEEYTKDMPLPRTSAARGMHSFHMAHNDHLGLDMEDLLGFLGLDGIPLETTRTALHTPMFDARKERMNAQSKGNTRRIFGRRQTNRSQAKEMELGKPRSQYSRQQKMLIDLLLLGAHEPLHAHSDEAMKAYNALIDAKTHERMRHIKQSRHHHDAVGYGGRGSKDMLLDVLGDDDAYVPSQHAIYSKEEYQDYIKRLDDLNQPYRPPTPKVKNITTRGRLEQEIKRLDNMYQVAKQRGDEQAMGQRAKELNSLITGFQDNKGRVVGYHQYEDDDGVIQNDALVIDATPSFLQSSYEARLMRMIHQASEDGDTQLLERLNQRLSKVRENPLPVDGGEMKLENDARLLQNNVDTLNAVEQIFQQALRPTIEKLFPGVFTEDNDKAWVATAYALKLAEQIAMLKPETREKLLKDGISIGKKTAKFDLPDDVVKGLKELRVNRNVHSGSPYMAEKMLDRIYGGVQPKGHRVASDLADGVDAVEDDDVSIFNQVMENVKAASKEQEISWKDAFVARYALHNNDGVMLTGANAKDMLDIVDLPKRGGNNYVFNNGGSFAELDAQIHGVRHGGASATLKRGKKNQPVSFDRERQAIVRVLQNAHKLTEQGSDVALDFSKLRMFQGNAPQRRPQKVMNFHNGQSLRNIADVLGDATSKRVLRNTSTNSEPVMMGSTLGDSMGELGDRRSNLHNAPVTPVFTCADKKFHLGYATRRPLPFTAIPGALNDAKVYFENEDTHTFNPPPAMKLVMPPKAMKRANPDLPQLDTNNLQYLDYTQFEGQPNPNQRLGQDLHAVMANAQDQMPEVGEGFNMSAHILDVALDDTLLIKEDGKPQPVKFMHRIFDLDDMQHLRGFTGDWVISLYPQGEHVIATKDKKGITAYGVDGEVKLDETILEEADKVYEKDFTVHAVLHDGLMTVIDLLKTADEDTHNMPTKDRIRHLRAQYESSEHIKMPEPINTKRSDDEGLQTAIDGLRKENDGVDILLRDANATYMKGESRHPKWVLLSKEKMVDVIILSASGTTYGIGVGPLMHPENYGKRAQQVGEEHYMNVGSAKGPRGLKVGDFATVRCTGVSASKKEHPVYRIRSAKITDNEPFAANSVETLAIMSGEHHVPQRVSMKKGNIIIRFPAFDDEVICKTRKEDGLWHVEPQSSVWGNEYLVRLARDQEAYWVAKAAWLLKEEDVEEPEYDEVEPEPPAGHSKKRKHVLEEEEEVIKRGLDLIERGLEHLAKEKITSTGVQGLGMDYATPDESPRGPTQNIRDNTMPDFDPQARADDELKPATAKKTKRLRSNRGETARLEDEGVIAIEKGSLDIA